MCVHDIFSINEAREYGYSIYLEDLVDGDNFPVIENGVCREECKEKMKEIYKLVLGDYLKTVTNYFDDVRIFKNDCAQEIKGGLYNGLGFYDGFLGCEKVPTPVKKRAQNIMISFKVGVLNGKPVRLCDVPSGVECEYSIQSFYDEKNNKVIND